MINGIEAKDTGSIKCVISNKNGTDESLAKVIAVGKLSPFRMLLLAYACHH